MSARVQGYCPACGWHTLFLGDGGFVTCSRLGCPNPTAASDILDDRETRHIVTFTEDGFTIRHPLIERLDDVLLRCGLHRFCLELDGPPVRPGRYRAWGLNGDEDSDTYGVSPWRWERLA